MAGLVAGMGSVAGWMEPAAAAVYVGATFNKSIDSVPDSSVSIPTESLVQISDLGFDPTTELSGTSDIQRQYIDLSSAVSGGNFVVDASHLLSYADDSNYQLIVSFQSDEVVLNGAGAVGKEDLVLITNNGGVMSSALLADFSPDNLVNNVNLNALYFLSGEPADCMTDAGCEVAVSFDKDVTNLAGTGLDMTKDDLTRFTITSGAPDYANASTYINFEFGSDANLDAFTITKDGIALGSFDQTIQDPQDGNILENDIWAFNSYGSPITPGATVSVTDVGVRLFMDDVSVDTSTDLESLFMIDVPEPGSLALLGFGLSVLLVARHRRKMAAA